MTIAGMLYQEDEHGVESAIYYLSKILNDAKTRYSHIKKLPYWSKQLQMSHQRKKEYL